MVKASDHGLGFLLDRTTQDAMPRPDDEGVDDHPDPDQHRRFADKAWELILAWEHNRPIQEPDWLDLPAVARLPLGTRDAMRAVKKWNKQHPPSERIRPHGFVLTCLVAPLGAPPGTDPDEFRPSPLTNPTLDD